ncbi:hypothetical protein [Yoonia algicola]|uniref:Lipoprotein n=1 Tax=Yoonia algicola TaxID=3137368 RepID=A0AAN0M2I8_9RHOB
MKFNLITGFGVGAMILMSACAPKPAPVAMVIYAEPTFDKLGNPSCRPGNVPIGGAYTAELPLCDVVNAGAPVVMVAPVVAADDGVVGDGGTVIVDPDDPNGGNQNQNQNQNQNENQNENQNQSGG